MLARPRRRGRPTGLDARCRRSAGWSMLVAGAIAVLRPDVAPLALGARSLVVVGDRAVLWVAGDPDRCPRDRTGSPAAAGRGRDASPGSRSSWPRAGDDRRRVADRRRRPGRSSRLVDLYGAWRAADAGPAFVAGAARAALALAVAAVLVVIPTVAFAIVIFVGAIALDGHRRDHARGGAWIPSDRRGSGRPPPTGLSDLVDDVAPVAATSGPTGATEIVDAYGYEPDVRGQAGAVRGAARPRRRPSPAPGSSRNSVAAIIGAMIVAPLMGPIVGIAIGIVTGSSRRARGESLGSWPAGIVDHGPDRGGDGGLARRPDRAAEQRDRRPDRRRRWSTSSSPWRPGRPAPTPSRTPRSPTRCPGWRSRSRSCRRSRRSASCCATATAEAAVGAACCSRRTSCRSCWPRRVVFVLTGVAPDRRRRDPGRADPGLVRRRSSRSRLVLIDPAGRSAASRPSRRPRTSSDATAAVEAWLAPAPGLRGRRRVR